MPISQDRLAYLLDAYSRRKATEAEEQELFALIKENNIPQAFNDHIQQLIQDFDHKELHPSVEWESLYQQIQDKAWPEGEKETVKILRRSIWPRIAVAACILLILGAGAYFWPPSSIPPKNIVVNSKPTPLNNDVSPGMNGAILTLANGSHVILDSAGNEMLDAQGSAKLQNRNGQLSYHNELAAKGGEVLYNTMTTAKGRQYRLMLADGSKVWLNASSSITYPTSFTGNQRKVTITGEAYFEIAHDVTKPFSVSANGTEVLVLGTHFNINAYSDEADVKTTLLEGKVKISSTDNGKWSMLKPGQQASISHESNKIVVEAVDLQEVVAWKDGLFIMKKADISSIMRQIARWYDVEIFYPDGVPPGKISGDLPRNMNLSKVLEVMELSGFHFAIEGKKVVVRP